MHHGILAARRHVCDGVLRQIALLHRLELLSQSLPQRETLPRMDLLVGLVLANHVLRYLEVPAVILRSLDTATIKHDGQ